MKKSHSLRNLDTALSWFIIAVLLLVSSPIANPIWACVEKTSHSTRIALFSWLRSEVSNTTHSVGMNLCNGWYNAKWNNAIFFVILNFLFHFALALSMRNEIKYSFYFILCRYNEVLSKWKKKQKTKTFHFAMIGGILNFISFCIDSMRSVLNEKLYFALKDGTSFQSSRKHLLSKVTPNLHLTYSKMGETWHWY